MVERSNVIERSNLLDRRRSPLHRLTAELTAGSGDDAALREVPFLTQIGLRARPGSASASALESALGGPLPSGVGVVTALPDDDVSALSHDDVSALSHDDGRHVLWLGPDEFLVIAPDEAEGGPDPAAICTQLTLALGALPGQVVDLSANRTTLQLSGRHAQDVLQKSCRLDLHPRVFLPGRAVSTLLEGVGIILWRVEEQAWRVMPRSSFAIHVARWLLDGMREYV